MKISSLQKARYEYSPKLPGMLRHGIILAQILDLFIN